MISIKLQDGIIMAKYDKSVVLTLETAKELVAQRLSIQNGKSYPMMIYVNGLIAHPKAVRSFMATGGIEGITCGAFIVCNMYEKYLIKLFLLIDAPKVPAKIFSDESEAILWLNSYNLKL